MEVTLIQSLVRTALEEDIGSGDITAEIIPTDKKMTAFIISREDAIFLWQRFRSSRLRARG